MKRLVGSVVLAFIVAAAWPGCSSSAPQATARMVLSRHDLVGGERALGEVGDYLIENDKVRVIIQKPGFSRGFGVYGGSLIDADLRRPSEEGSSGTPTGFDNFGELFPAFFLQAADINSVQVASDGSKDGIARIDASGTAGDFLEMLAVLNRAITGSSADFQNTKSAPKIRYTNSYELKPGDSHLTLRFNVKNISNDTLMFPGKDAQQLLGVLGLPLDGFTVPVAEVALYGATSEVFIPGVGFDLRFGLEDAYNKGIDWPAFPGFATDFIASRGNQTSYALALGDSDRNYAWNKKSYYDDGGRTPITKHSIMTVLSASSFVGLFYENAPPELKPGESFETVRYFFIGGGDVGSLVDQINTVRGNKTGRMSGQVLDEGTFAPADGTSVIVFQRDPASGFRRPFSQYDVRNGGYFAGNLEPGEYSFRVLAKGRPITNFADFSIRVGETTELVAASPPPARLSVRVAAPSGDALPAKVTVVGTYDAKFSGGNPRAFLYDLQSGEPFRSSDLVTDDPEKPETRRFMEAVGFTRDGIAELTIRPGTYDVYVGRGPEYELVSQRVTVSSGNTTTVSQQLKRQIDTVGWIAADTHIHSRNSIDSSMTIDERVSALAAEGLEWVVSTDHNYVTDFAPSIARWNLNRWMFPSVGVEMSTLESGHFNGYPLRYETGPITHGSFEWARRTPEEIFRDLRKLGSLSEEKTIVQVNHPRDGVLGYFAQYSVDPLTFKEVAPSTFGSLVAPTGPAFRDGGGRTTFSLKFDLVEVANGKLYWELHHYRVPRELPAGELPPNLPPAGAILRDSTGDVLYPGAVDDWFNTLNLGYQYVAVGTGDSHSSFDEAGQFRTMIYTGEDDTQKLTEERIVDSLRSRRVIVSNGPMLDMYVDDPVKGTMGKTLVAAGSSVKLTYTLTAASWVGVKRVVIYRNGVIAKIFDLDESRDLSKFPVRDTVELPLAVDGQGMPIDSWFVVEAFGSRSLFPTVRPQEIRPVLLTDAVASLAGPLGIGSNEFGALKPTEVFAVYPYALTNPVWVTKAAGVFHAPGLVPVDVQNRPENDPQFHQMSEPPTQMPVPMRKLTLSTERNEPGRRRVPLFYPRRDNPFDFRKVLNRLGHLHGGHGE